MYLFFNQRIQVNNTDPLTHLLHLTLPNEKTKQKKNNLEIEKLVLGSIFSRTNRSVWKSSLELREEKISVKIW